MGVRRRFESVVEHFQLDLKGRVTICPGAAVGLAYHCSFVSHSHSLYRRSETGSNGMKLPESEKSREKWKAGLMPDVTPSSPAPNAPSGATQPLYSEKLWPAWWIWLVALGLSGAGILVFAPISLTTGIVAAAVIFTIIAALLVLSTPRISVTPGTLQVGRASIDRRFVGTVQAFRGEEATAERGTRLNALAFLCIRGWIDPVVRIEITDPEDTTPYWLASTRRPEEFAAALDSTAR
jgi:hypothetical protein